MPFSFILGAIDLVPSLDEFPPVLNILSIVSLVLLLAAWVKLRSRSWLGYRLLVAVLILNVAQRILLLILSALAFGTVAELVARCVGACVPSLIVLLVVRSYYDRRRLLFAPPPEIQPDPNRPPAARWEDEPSQ